MHTGTAVGDSGDKTGAAAEKKELARDRRDLKSDERDLKKDRADRRADRRDLRKDRAQRSMNAEGADSQQGNCPESGECRLARAVLEGRNGPHRKQPRGAEKTLHGLDSYLRENREGRRDQAALNSTAIK